MTFMLHVYVYMLHVYAYMLHVYTHALLKCVLIILLC